MIPLPTPWRSPGPPPLAFTLSSGLRVWHLHRPGLETLEVGIVYRDGPAFEAREQGGIAHLLEHGLMAGPEGMTPFNFHRTLEALGAALSGDIGREAAHLSMALPKAALPQALPLWAGLLLRPNLDSIASETGIIAQEALWEGSLERELERTSRQLLWPGSPIARPILGSFTSPSNISLGELRAHHTRSMVTNNARLYIAGDIEGQPAHSLLEDAFRDITQGPARRMGSPPDVPTLGPRLRFLEGPPPLGHLLLSLPFPGFLSPGYASLPALRTLLGDGHAGLLPWALIEDMGLCYHLTVDAQAYAQCAALDIHLSAPPEQLAPALRHTLSTLKGLSTTPPDTQHLERAKGQSRALAKMTLDTPGKALSPRAMVDLFDGALPPSTLHWDEDIAPWLARALRPESLSLVVKAPGDPTLGSSLKEVLHGPWT